MTTPLHWNYYYWWTPVAYTCEQAVTDKGTYHITPGNLLGFEPNDSKTQASLEPEAQGIEYLGHFENPKQVAEQHYLMGTVPTVTEDKR